MIARRTGRKPNQSGYRSMADAVRRHDLAGVLAHHEQDIVMFDVPPPLQSRGIDSRENMGSVLQVHKPSQAFDIQELAITAGEDVAFALAVMRCGSGTFSGSPEEGGFLFCGPCRVPLAHGLVATLHNVGCELANQVSTICEPVSAAVGGHRTENPFWGRETGPLNPCIRGSPWPPRDRQFVLNLRRSLKHGRFSARPAKRRFCESGWWRKQDSNLRRRGQPHHVFQ